MPHLSNLGGAHARPRRRTASCRSSHRRASISTADTGPPSPLRRHMEARVEGTAEERRQWWRVPVWGRQSSSRRGLRLKLAPVQATGAPPSRVTSTRRSLLGVHRRVLSASTEAGGAGDPSVHFGSPPSGDYVDSLPKFSGAEEAAAGGHDKHPSRRQRHGRRRYPPTRASRRLLSRGSSGCRSSPTRREARRSRGSADGPHRPAPAPPAAPGQHGCERPRVRQLCGVAGSYGSLACST